MYGQLTSSEKYCKLAAMQLKASLLLFTVISTTFAHEIAVRVPQPDLSTGSATRTSFSIPILRARFPVPVVGWGCLLAIFGEGLGVA